MDAFLGFLFVGGVAAVAIYKGLYTANRGRALLCIVLAFCGPPGWVLLGIWWWHSHANTPEVVVHHVVHDGREIVDGGRLGEGLRINREDRW